LPRKRWRSDFILLLFVLAFLLGSIRLWGRIFFPLPYKDLVEMQAFKYNLDPLLVTAVIREESAFDAKARSKHGALGLMQIMPETGAWISVQFGEEFSREELLRPETSIRYGVWYLDSLLTEYRGDPIKALAAYNAGSGKVKGWLAKGTWDGTLASLEKLPYLETRQYVIKIMRSYKIYRFLYRGRQD